VQVLVGGEEEQFVLDDGSAERSTRNIAVQLRHFVVGRYVGVLIEEEGRGVDPVGAAVSVGLAVQDVGARGSAQIDVRARGGTLRGVVHR
jgi:hypothetical protein